MKPRHARFLEALPKHGNKVLPSALEAGYSENYAKKRGKDLYRNALKAQVKDISIMIDNKQLDKASVHRMMLDIVGMTPESVAERLRNIATQEKDYSSALKVLAPLAKELGIHLDTEDTKVTVPILTVHTTNNPLVEPPKQDTP